MAYLATPSLQFNCMKSMLKLANKLLVALGKLLQPLLLFIISFDFIYFKLLCGKVCSSSD